MPQVLEQSLFLLGAQKESKAAATLVTNRYGKRREVVAGLPRSLRIPASYMFMGIWGGGLPKLPKKLL